MNILVGMPTYNLTESDRLRKSQAREAYSNYLIKQQAIQQAQTVFTNIQGGSQQFNPSSAATPITEGSAFMTKAEVAQMFNA